MVEREVWVGTRPLSHVLAALTRREHYAGIVQAMRTYRAPIRQLARYVSGRGSYPADVEVRTPTGMVALRCWTRHDLLTVHEVFCRNDYELRTGPVTVLDVGANIGVSAAYFLSRHPGNRVIAYEPVPTNLERLRRNLAPFGNRATVVAAAVGVENGVATFLTERTGRYGRLAVPGRPDEPFEFKEPASIEVEVRSLLDVIDAHPDANVLKLDIEGLEPALLALLHDNPVADRFRVVLAECEPAVNPLVSSHDLRQGPSIARFERRARSMMMV